MEQEYWELEEELRHHVQGEVRFDPYSRALYSTDASIYQIEPIGVVLPRDQDDVVATLDLAHRHVVAVLPRGAGTSLAGQAINRAIVLDFSKYMDQVLEVSPEEGWARVQPGITLDELNRKLRPHGLMFAPDPSTANRATVGGAIGNNSSGARSIIFGKTVDHLQEVRAVLSDSSPVTFGPLRVSEFEGKLAQDDLEGHVYRQTWEILDASREEIRRRFPRVMRRVSGYNLAEMLTGPVNLAKLVAGSEGTLVAVTEARVKLVPRPRQTALAVLHFRSLLEALEATVPLLEAGPAAIELLDRAILEQTHSQVGFARRLGFVQGDPAALLLVELFGDSEGGLRARLEGLEQRVSRGGLGYACVKILDPRAQQDVWAVRRAGLGLLMGVKGHVKPLPFVEDTAVSPEKLPEFIRRFDGIVRSNGTTATYYGHSSVGCLHVRPLINLKLQEGVDRMVRIATEVSDLVLEFGGALSGEHGDGIVRGVWTEKMFGPQLYQAFLQLKTAFDPRGIMNPGKIVETPPMTENLRHGPGYRAIPFQTHLDFSRDHGFAASVEMCNGQGACRKTADGTMCPSYMVTREEEHSTRGRANALRAVLSGLLPPEEFTSRRLYQVLDLCLECKGCKAECPSGVDMAKLKYEFLAHYHKEHGYPLRTRLFANVAGLGRLGSDLAPFSNWLIGSSLSRWALERVGIHSQRRMPPFARPTLEHWFRRHRPLDGAGGRGQVVLFDDTFTNYHYPSVGIAATSLLERMGYGVHLAPRWCCGRPMISKGMLERARRNAQHNVGLLYPLVEQGMAVVGCEPSCLLTLRDEYLDLLPGDEKAQKVAANSYLIDEFLADQASQGGVEGIFQPRPGKVLFHGHCHQKALIGVEASVRALKLVPGVEVEALDSGCCGMAGAFGFEKEHYELSMAIGERALFPAVRANPGATVVVTGVSCRQQIEHGTGVRPLHLAEFLAGAIEEQLGKQDGPT